METRKLGEDRFGNEDWPVQYCPVCGSDDLTSFGTYDNLLGGKRRADITCAVCEWSYIIIIYEDGKKEFPIRRDSEEPDE